MTKLLIVDDNEQNLYMLQVLLRGHGYEVVSATNGVEALEMARRDPPDLIVSDILMPVMDGFVLCRHWKEDEQLKEIPFVYYTATYTDPKDEEFALGLGAERFLVKPIEPEEFIGILQEVIEAYHAGQLVASRERMVEEAVYFKEYNEALIRKLEDKMLLLEEAKQALERDIAERMRAEKALKESEYKYRSIFENINDGLWTHDFEGRIIDANKVACQLVGKERDEVIGGNLAIFSGKETISQAESRINEIIQNGSLVFDAEIVREGGTRIPVNVSAKLISKDSGGVIQSFVRDITERKRAEEALRKAHDELEMRVEERTAELIEVNKALQTEITERKRAEVALRESEIRFRELYDNMSSGVAVYDVKDDGRDIRIRSINKSGERISKVKREDVVGRSILEVFPGVKEFGLVDVLQRVWRTGEPEHFPVSQYKDNRISHWAENYVYRLPSGEVVAVHDDVTGRKRTEEALRKARDELEMRVEERTVELIEANKALQMEITERKQAEEALRENEAKLQSIFRAAPTGIGLVSNRVLLQVNDRICEMLGYSSDELVGKSARVLYPTDEDFEYVGREKYTQIRERATGTVETRWQRKDGQVIDVLLSSTPLNPADLSAGVTFTALDITARKQAEEALKRSYERFATIMDSLDQGVYVADMDTYEILFINKYLRNIFGDVVGATCWQALQSNKTGPCDFCTNDKLIDANGEPTGLYAWGFQNTITNRWYDIRDRAIPWLDGRVVRLEVATDITERKRAEEALQQAHQELATKANELEAANAELSQYAYVVSHDLRAPLRAIHNYADFIREDLAETLDKDLRLYLAGLGSAVREAEELVGDLLELSRIGRKSVPVETVDVGAFLRELIAMLSPPQDVEIVMADDWPTINVEPVLLGQIFQNLISNAIKFNHSPSKRVELGWRSASPLPPVGGTEGEAPAYEFFVRDNGIGIDPRYHEQIFRVFERLHTRKEYEGTGVGLAIVKKATGQLGGSIRIESQPGQGSTFFVTLPRIAEQIQEEV